VDLPVGQSCVLSLSSDSRAKSWWGCGQTNTILMGSTLSRFVEELSRAITGSVFKLTIVSDCQGFLNLHGLRVGVWVRIPVPATYKMSPRTSKTDENWWRYDQNGRKHHLAHILVISWLFWLIFRGKTRGVVGKGPWGRVMGTLKKPQGYPWQSLTIVPMPMNLQHGAHISYG